jgi:hypothetical protein
MRHLNEQIQPIQKKQSSPLGFHALHTHTLSNIYDHQSNSKDIYQFKEVQSKSFVPEIFVNSKVMSNLGKKEDRVLIAGLVNKQLK